MLTSIAEAKMLTRHRAEQFMDAFMTDILVTVRWRTPIDTGKARSKWARYPEGIAPLGQPFMVGNTAPYIVRLEYGWSKQAPVGMARITLAESQMRADLIVDRLFS